VEIRRIVLHRFTHDLESSKYEAMIQAWLLSLLVHCACIAEALILTSPLQKHCILTSSAIW
jgi:hypothetical protein